MGCVKCGRMLRCYKLCGLRRKVSPGVACVCVRCFDLLVLLALLFFLVF